MVRREFIVRDGLKLTRTTAACYRRGRHLTLAASSDELKDSFPQKYGFQQKRLQCFSTRRSG